MVVKTGRNKATMVNAQYKVQFAHKVLWYWEPKDLGPRVIYLDALRYGDV